VGRDAGPAVTVPHEESRVVESVLAGRVRGRGATDRQSMNHAIPRPLKGDCTGYLEPFSRDGLKRFGALTASNYADLMKTCPFPGRAPACGRVSLPR
jgi:hypothetical protein